MPGELHGGAVEAGRDEKLRAGIETTSRVIDIQHRSRTDENFRATALCQLANDFDCSRNGHGDFDDRDAALADRFGGEACFARRGSADNGDDSNFLDTTPNPFFIHVDSLACTPWIFTERCAHPRPSLLARL